METDASMPPGGARLRLRPRVKPPRIKVLLRCHLNCQIGFNDQYLIRDDAKLAQLVRARDCYN